MKNVLDFRGKYSRARSEANFKELLIEVIEYRKKCIFPAELQTVDDLIEDIEIKIEQLAPVGKESLNEKEHDEFILEEVGRIDQSHLVESIIPSVNCTLYLEDSCGLREIEREAIRITLVKNKNNRTATAKDLGISIRTLRNKLNEYLMKGEVAIYELSRVR